MAVQPLQQRHQAAQVAGKTLEHVVHDIVAQMHTTRTGLLAQHRAQLGFAQALQVKHIAPAHAAAQVVAQWQVGRRQFAGGQHPALHAAGRAHGVDEPVEGHVLLGIAVEVYIVQQHRRPALVKTGGVFAAGVAPADAGTLLAQGFAHRLQQVRLAAAGLAPQVGGHRHTAGFTGAAGTVGQHLAQVLQHVAVRAGKEALQRGRRRQTDVQGQLLHGCCTTRGRRQVQGRRTKRNMGDGRCGQVGAVQASAGSGGKAGGRAVRSP